MSPQFVEAKELCDIAVRVEQSDNEGCELIGLLHPNLVVTRIHVEEA